MSTLSELKIRLSEVLKRSETRNLTEIQRERAINDALVFDVNNYRPWDFLVENTYTQAVDGVINIPSNFRKEYSLRYNSDNDYKFIDQTKFLDEISYTATITEKNDKQVISIYDDSDQGVDQENKTSDTDLGLHDDATRERLFQTFTTDTSSFKGAMLKLKTVGSPTGTLTLGLYATSSSLPTGSALATKTLRVSELSSDNEFYYFHLPYSTTESTEYALVLSTSATLDAVNYVAWEYSTSSQISDGTRGIYNGSYSTGTGDMYFITYDKVFEFQYSKRLSRMEESTDTTGLSEEFDEPITMLAAARLVARQAGGRDNTKLSLAQAFRYGTGGNSVRPTPDSSYGKLNVLWDEYAIRTRRPLRRMINVFENTRRSSQDPSLNLI